MIKHSIAIRWYEMFLCILLYNLLNSLCLERCHKSLIYSLKRESLNDVTAVGAILPRPQQLAFKSLYNCNWPSTFFLCMRVASDNGIVQPMQGSALRPRQIGHRFADDNSKCFSLMKMSEFWLHIHINMFLLVQLIIIITNSGSSLTPIRRQAII